MKKKRRNRKPAPIWRNLLAEKDLITHFKNRLIIKMREPYASIKNPDSINSEFALCFGYSVPPPSTGFLLNIDLDIDYTPLFDQSYVKNVIEKASDLGGICFALECLLNSLRGENDRTIKLIERAIREAVSLSPGIEIDISFHRSEIRVRPSGDAFLDKYIVDEVIDLLANRPKLSKHFKEALRIFASDCCCG
jgi:hypothetical protein